MLNAAVPVHATAACMDVVKRVVTFELARIHRAGLPVSLRSGTWARTSRAPAILDDLRIGTTGIAVARRHGLFCGYVLVIRCRVRMLGAKARTDDEREIVATHHDLPISEVAVIVG